MGREFITPAEVGVALGVTTNRAYQLIAAGEIPAVRFGRRIRVPLESWEQWLASKKAEAKEAVGGR